ncbi:MAG: hypothetical protein U0Q03_17485 [Acidimicrobiales bacterium]
MLALLALLALSVSSARQLGVGIVVLFVVLAVLAATAIANIGAKIITMLIMIGFALGVWTQRSNLSDCAERAEAKVTVGDSSPTTCRFFGFDVDVPGVPTPGDDTDTSTG